MRLQLFNLYKSYASYISLGNIVIFLIACGLLIFGITIYISIQNDAALLQWLLMLSVCVHWRRGVQGH